MSKTSQQQNQRKNFTYKLKTHIQNHNFSSKPGKSISL